MAWSKTGANQNLTWGYSVYTGVNQAVPVGTVAQTGQTGDNATTKTLNVAATTADLVVDGFVVNGGVVTGSGPSAGSGQGQRWSTSVSTTQGGSSDKPGSPTTPISWTAAAGSGIGLDWALIGFALHPASGGGGPLSSVTHTQSSTTATNLAPGSSVTDTATVSGSGPTPTGSVTFFLCQPATVSGNGGNCSSGGSQVGAAKTLTAGQTTSDATTTTTAAGTYCWRAVYAGDSVYNPSSEPTSSNECFTVVVALL